MPEAPALFFFYIFSEIPQRKYGPGRQGRTEPGFGALAVGSSRWVRAWTFLQATAERCQNRFPNLVFLGRLASMHQDDTGDFGRRFL